MSTPTRRPDISDWTLRTGVEGVPGKHWYERSDGAYVYKSTDQQHSFDLNPRSRMWMAYSPDGTYLKRNDLRTILHIPRKFQTALAAMLTLDRECPIKTTTD